MDRKEQGQKIIKKLFANWEIKLISVLTGFGLWFTVMYFENPPGEETFTDVPVQFINTNDLTDKGYVYEVLDGTDVVNEVTVKGTRKALSELKSAGTEAIVATADFATRDAAGNVEIKLRAMAQNPTAITEITSSSEGAYLKLGIEEKVEKSITVDIIIEGQELIAEGHQLGTARVEQNRVKITGGKSKVEQVCYAAVSVDVTGSDADISMTDTIKLYDSEWQLLEGIQVQKNINATKINVGILGTKTVPIEYAVTGEVMEGYRMTGQITSSKEMITLAGTDNVLNAVNSIVIPSEVLNVSGMNKNLEEVINLRSYLPAGVQIADSEAETTTTIQVVIEKIQERKYKMTAANVSIINLPAGFAVTGMNENTSYDVVVSGLNGELNQIRESTLSGTVDIQAWMAENDMSRLEEKLYAIPAQITLPSGVELTEPVEIQVTFKKVRK